MNSGTTPSDPRTAAPSVHQSTCRTGNVSKGRAGAPSWPRSAPEEGAPSPRVKRPLAELHRRPERAFVLPEEEERQRLDVASPPPPMQRRVGSPHDSRGQAACLKQCLRDAIPNDEFFVVTSVSHERPAVSRCPSEEIPFLHGATDSSIWRRAGDQRTRGGVGRQIGDQSGVNIVAPRRRLLNRRQTADQQLIVIRVEDDADVTVCVGEGTSRRR